MSGGFSWDRETDAAYVEKHKVGFRQAVEIFKSFRLTREDERRDYGERRMIALGVFDGIILRVVYTERDNVMRIISAWKASGHDRHAYATAKGGDHLRQSGSDAAG